ncbi:MAG: iron-containing alcohol dehydrogenase [Candidatus Odinarchaeota archaeon]
MLPSYYEFYNPVKILSGKKALDNLPHELGKLGAKKPLIVTDQGVNKAGLIKHVRHAFDGTDTIIGAIYDQVPSDSSKNTVNELVQVYRANQCDSIIAVGGGSVIDTAKGLNILVTEDADDLMKFQGVDYLEKPMKPFIVVPTTAGTGSEVTGVAVIADPGRNNLKMGFASRTLLPDVAVIDPRMTVTLPPRLTAATGIDALAHAMEGYICLQKNPLSDAYAWAAIKLISDHLVKVVKNGNDENGRLALANAACMAGVTVSNSIAGIVHSLGHATGGICGIPHGDTINIFLPHGLEYNMSRSRDLIAELLLPLAGPEIYSQTPLVKRAEKTVEFIRELQDELYKLTKLPRTLKEAGVPKEQFEKIARMAIDDGSVAFNPVELEYSDALRILNKAYE